MLCFSLVMTMSVQERTMPCYLLLFMIYTFVSPVDLTAYQWLWQEFLKLIHLCLSFTFAWNAFLNTGSVSMIMWIKNFRMKEFGGWTLGGSKQWMIHQGLWGWSSNTRVSVISYCVLKEMLKRRLEHLLMCRECMDDGHKQASNPNQPDSQPTGL